MLDIDDKINDGVKIKSKNVNVELTQAADSAA
jgi:hypothetical protein